MKRILVATAFIGYTLAACTSVPSGSLTHTIPASDKFGTGKVEWDENLGTYSYLWGVTELNGEILICGVGKYSNPAAKPETHDVMRRVRAELAETPILTDMTFFSEVGPDADLRQQVANCSRTGVPVPSGSWTVILKAPRSSGIGGDR